MRSRTGTGFDVVAITDLCRAGTGSASRAGRAIGCMPWRGLVATMIQKTKQPSNTGARCFSCSIVGAIRGIAGHDTTGNRRGRFGSQPKSRKACSSGAARSRSQAWTVSPGATCLILALLVSFSVTGCVNSPEDYTSQIACELAVASLESNEPEPAPEPATRRGVFRRRR